MPQAQPQGEPQRVSGRQAMGAPPWAPGAFFFITRGTGVEAVSRAATG